ncbi:MAG TPA: DUF6766 family protein [Flavisolibacter sp.]|nr:DUF6766 family protein [Flavisolibacter sp.]
MKKFIRNNSLSLVFLLLFIVAIVAQAFTGMQVYNEEMAEEGGVQVNFLQYIFTGNFIEATFENWESEFLQMGLFVWLSMFLYQKGSSESKDPDESEEVEREPDPNREGVPAPVKHGGWQLAIYKHSLSYALFFFFLLSFLAHWYGSLKDYNQEQVIKGKPVESAMQYLSNPKLWSESFENWQSEFLSVFAIVVLSIFLRQKNSPQSKPVDAPNSETGS